MSNPRRKDLMLIMLTRDYEPNTFKKKYQGIKFPPLYFNKAFP